MDLTVAAHKEIVDLHVLLQSWFRGEGEADPQRILSHFTSDYGMLGAAGRASTYASFEVVLPKLFGSRPGLVMEIEDVVVRASFSEGYLVTYKEIQTQDGKRDERGSAVVFRKGTEEQPLLWQYLQETFFAL